MQPGLFAGAVGSSRVVYPVLVALLLIGLYTLLPGKSIEYDFNERESSRWQIVGGIGEARHDRFLLRAGEGRWAMLVSPPARVLDRAYWDQLPYVRLTVVPAATDRHIALAWLPRGKQSPELSLPGVIPAGAERVVFDVRSPPFYARKPAWTLPGYGRFAVKQFGILLQAGADLELKKVSLMSKLGVVDLMRTVARQYFDVEAFQAYSINAYYGARVLGQNLNLVLGIVFILAVVFFLVFGGRRTAFSMAAVGATCFLVHAVTFDVRLFNYWRDSLATSAWVLDKYEEYESRFGREFSLLARQVDEKVPRGSKVMFLQPAERFGREVSWPSVLFDGLYDVTGPGDSHWQSRNNFGQTPSRIRKLFDYVVYYKSLRYRYDEEKNLLLEKDKERKSGIKVATVATVSPRAKIFKVIRE